MAAPDTTAPTEVLMQQASRPVHEHFIYKQYLDGKKKSKVRLPDRRKSFLWLVSVVCVICVILTIAASLNPVPIFSSSKGLMSVIALYPNSSLPTAREPDGGSTRTSLEARNLLNYEYADSHDLEKRGGQRTYWNDACACYRTRLHPHSDEYDATTYTTTTATGLISFKPEPSRKPPKPEPTTTNPPKKSEEMQVDPGAFAGLFLGITGACLQRRSGVLVCTSNSFSPKYHEIYEVAGLASNVIAQLPTGTGGASVGLLISLITYLLTTLAFIVSALPRAWFYGPRGHKTLGSSGKLPDLRHQWTLIFATGLAAISTFIVVAASVQLQNAFGASAEAVEAWDKTKTLRAKLLNAYTYLYTCAILSGLAVVSSLAMIAYDFQHPWWLSSERSRLQAITTSGPGFGEGLGRPGSGRPRDNSWSTGNELDGESVISEGRLGR